MASGTTKSFSLVKYDTPILVSKSFGKGKQAGSQMSSTATSASSSKSKDEPGSMRTEDYLNSILPPREFQDGGQLWVQYVSPTPATRIDVINLQEELDKKLQER